MAAEHPMTSSVRGFYNQLNRDMHLPVSRCNAEQLTALQKQHFDCLSEETKKRYYGTGLNIPENLTGKRVLDIGCGSGSLVFILSKLVGPTGYVVGIDFSDVAIKTAQEQSDYHCKQWGYDKPNFEFRVLNAEKLDEAGFSPGEFDIIVSNGVFTLLIDKQRVFRAACTLLKQGGQFYLNDVYAEKDTPEENKNDEYLWSNGATGAMRWDTLGPVVSAVGFTSPYLTCASPMNIVKEEYQHMLENARFSCAGWRLFKLDPNAAKKGASLVTYNGGITDYPDAFPWDVDLTFKKGEGVEVDGELATTLSSIYLSDCFTFLPASGQPATCRNQNPFLFMDKLRAEGKLPEEIYYID